MIKDSLLTKNNLKFILEKAVECSMKGIKLYKGKALKAAAASFIFSLVVPVVSAAARLPKDWHKNLNDTCQGINLRSAEDFLRKRKATPVIVGIIDSGYDTLSVDLAPALWVNPNEKAGNKDCDGNGYAGDVHGWNFLGTADGSFNMTSAGTEEYREFKRLYPKYKGSKDDRSEEYAYYKRMRRKAGIDSYLKFAEYTAQKDDAYLYLDSLARKNYGNRLDSVTIVDIFSMPDTLEVQFMVASNAITADIFRAGAKSLWKDLITNHKSQFELMQRRIYGIEHDADKRLMMGDNLKDENDTRYGNSCLTADGCDHGTFVAGIIGGRGTIDPAVSGIYQPAQLMIIRAVPDGDEYDKDVATSIRYAVDNGAKVVNLSLGKMTSPDSAMVNRAIEYALRHDVLLVQASGNSHLNIDSLNYYPSAIDSRAKRYPNLIRVGASDADGNVAGMSNYGATKVDVFAPGVSIVSNTTGNQLMTADGTSIAAPVVAAVAAMIRAYFPKLKAADVRDILISSCRRGNPALAGKCVSEGVVDAGEAVRLAANYKKRKK